MSKVQVIEKNGQPEFYVVPADLWEQVRGLLEDAEDTAAYGHAVAAEDGVRFPAAVAVAIADGTQPVRAWREHLGLAQEALAAAAGISTPFLSQIERGKRAGTVATLKKLALAMGVPLGALT